MCGIAGAIGESAFDPSWARHVLAHRGPDGYGVLVQGKGLDRVRFAHTRLAIQDLSNAGLQPMRSHCGRFVLAFNGEVYNFRELAESFGDGARWRTRTDSEVLLEGFARDGIDFVRRCRGMFAFALWDEREHELWLVRDRFGEKPLYFAMQQDRGIVFASETRALVATGAASGRIDPEAVDSFLRFGAVAEPRTIFEDVEALPPGSFLRFRRGQVTRGTYWSFPGRQRSVAETKDAVEHVGAMLAESLRLRLISDVPVGILLSSGIDSTALALLAARERGGDVDAFTVASSSADDPSDEAMDAAAFARELGIRHHRVRLDPSTILDGLPRAWAAMDQPTIDGLNTFFVADAVHRAGIKVALSGLGSDELFLGYPSARTLHPTLRAMRLVAPVLARARSLPMPSPSRTFALPLTWGKILDAPHVRATPEDVVAFRRTLFGRAQRRALLGRVPMPGEVESAPANGDSLLRWSVAELSGYTRNTLLRDADAFGMRHPVEIRMPYLDHVLAETVLTLPDDVRFAPGRPKALLVDAVGDPRLRSIARRPKRGFVLPIVRWLTGALRASTETCVHDRMAWVSLGLEPSAVSDVWTRFLSRPSPSNASRMWALVALHAFGENARRAAAPRP